MGATDKPFLSVITINRNNMAGLRITIESVLSQSGIEREDLEYIIIDGNSDDGSVEVIKEYVKREDLPQKISYWVSERDGGIYSAMNKGIRAAHGEYIAMLNSGDYYVKDALRGIKDEAIANEGAILYGAMDCMKNGKFVRVGGGVASTLPRHMIAHPSTFVPMKIYEKYGLYEEGFRVLGDWDLFATFAENKVPFHHISKIIVAFDENGISKVIDRPYRKERAWLLRRHWGKYAPLLFNVKRIVKAVTPNGLWDIAAKVHQRRVKSSLHT